MQTAYIYVSIFIRNLCIKMLNMFQWFFSTSGGDFFKRFNIFWVKLIMAKKIFTAKDAKGQSYGINVFAYFAVKLKENILSMRVL